MNHLYGTVLCMHVFSFLSFFSSLEVMLDFSMAKISALPNLIFECSTMENEFKELRFQYIGELIDRLE